MNIKAVFTASVLLALLVVTVSSIGFYTPNFYEAETFNWQVQSMGQDVIDLFFIAPFLLITSILMFIGNNTAKMLWAGILLYLTYTFFLYSFDVHFNKLFALYCICLGLSFFLFMYFLFTHIPVSEVAFNNKKLLRFNGIYFIIIAVLFYLQWLAEIIPSIITNTVPASVQEAGLFTNGVHVLDLSIVLPLIFITGILLLKGRKAGIILAPVLLSFFILMNITIAALIVMMKRSNLTESILPAVMMGAFTIISVVFIVLLFRNATSATKQIVKPLSAS